MKITILLADDQNILREGLRSMLERDGKFKVVGEADNGIAACELARTLNPDVILLDITMPELNGIDAAAAIIAANPFSKIVVLSVHSDRHFVAKMMAVGARGYLPKDCDYEEIVLAVHAVVAGEMYISSIIQEEIETDSIIEIVRRKSDAWSDLTLKEREILQMIADGKTSKEIAYLLCKSLKTVERYRHSIITKLDIHSVAELTKYAIAHGVTTLKSS